MHLKAVQSSISVVVTYLDINMLFMLQNKFQCTLLDVATP